MLTITTHHGTPLEERGREQLQRLLGTYDVDRRLFTRQILIRSHVKPPKDSIPATPKSSTPNRWAGQRDRPN